MSYHKNKNIKKGTVGEFSKIEEEFEELKDAVDQNDKILILCEMADLLGAVELYLKENYYKGITLESCIKFSRKTQNAFKDGTRVTVSEDEISRQKISKETEDILIKQIDEQLKKLDDEMAEEVNGWTENEKQESFNKLLQFISYEDKIIMKIELEEMRKEIFAEDELDDLDDCPKTNFNKRVNDSLIKQQSQGYKAKSQPYEILAESGLTDVWSDPYIFDNKFNL